MTIPIPDPKPVKDLFQDLLGRTVTIASSDKAVVPSARRACCTGLYVDGNLDTKAIVCADLDLSARAGAALGLVPPTGAQTAIDNLELPPALYDNFYEVMNIFASLFNVGENEAHLKLNAVFQPGSVIPTHAAMLLRGLGKRADYSLDIEGYGLGSIGIVVPM
ncbi:hypothetical protein KEM60_01645 [Austwickia sp. TVS 96-490-7B]|uniref:hypothetical protein n=1 Tax=Austwickia sp. TVS 96-490-7B TaxID=2830843 RepID=UPI001C587814|nr:hypothetical protein [Austwickia sp. TVS 96-490-7B]MBW3085445.1 hypothetical protein [Austwickia sp. TVS 96-490-7B]